MRLGQRVVDSLDKSGAKIRRVLVAEIRFEYEFAVRTVLNETVAVVLDCGKKTVLFSRQYPALQTTCAISFQK